MDRLERELRKAAQEQAEFMTGREMKVESEGASAPEQQTVERSVNVWESTDPSVVEARNWAQEMARKAHERR
jgi:hypothetical protein